MSNTLFNNHPLINNSNQYFYEKKYISISSVDRDFAKYPNSAEFEVTFPQEYLNVASARLYNWSFPANYNVFSNLISNVTMKFKFDKLFNPGTVPISDPVLEGIFDALYNNGGVLELAITIESGFYNPLQMATELTNKFNEVVTNYIINFFNNNKPTYNTALSLFKEYDRFVIVYNTVSQKLWFGNRADQFTLTNDSDIYMQTTINNSCIKKTFIPDYYNWGLPGYLGFSRCNAPANSVDEILASVPNASTTNPSLDLQLKVPRFYYGDSSLGSSGAPSGDNGYWLLPLFPSAPVYFVQAPFKISFMGQAYIYMEVDGMNCIDETVPWNLSTYTLHNNRTNGNVNSAFAKIGVMSTPIAQWFDSDSGPYKFWNPPAERLSKFKFKLRYHNGQLVDFGQFEYSFMIELSILKPQQERTYSIKDAKNLSQLQAYDSTFR